MGSEVTVLFSLKRDGSLLMLAQILMAEGMLWHKAVVPGWYGAGERMIEIASDTAMWRHSGMLIVPIHWVLIRDPDALPTSALICTDVSQTPAQIVSWPTLLVRRTHLPGNPCLSRRRNPAAVLRQSDRPRHALPVRSILDCTLLATRLPTRQRRRVASAAWHPKPRPTFPDALTAVRCAIWRERTSATSPHRTKLRFRLSAP